MKHVSIKSAVTNFFSHKCAAIKNLIVFLPTIRHRRSVLLVSHIAFEVAGAPQSNIVKVINHNNNVRRSSGWIDFRTLHHITALLDISISYTWSKIKIGRTEKYVNLAKWINFGFIRLCTFDIIWCFRRFSHCQIATNKKCC